ncbi:MAG: NAD(P)-dependent oxidoreductase [Roseiarcus sp.]|jgi:nucleoside-diphosphate-sugar epimerase
MLTHHADGASLPERIVVVGANSFVGKALLARLAARGATVLALGRAEIDLAADDAGARLGALIRPSDSVVAIAAKAPCRNADDFLVNARILRAFAAGLAAGRPAHVVAISSDAVYADGPLPLRETSAAAPGSLHGAMHLAREIALRGLGLPLAVLRPTLLYGAADPHNGYGPNQFRRLANAGAAIALFGEGEERRDHVDVDDVAELAARVLTRRSTGVLNVASGSVASFREIAQAAARLAGRRVAIEGRSRSGPMPHGGYRPFDPAATFAAFPDFGYTALEEGMAKAQAKEFPHG